MKQETEAKIKHVSWGLVFGAVLAMIIGFWWGGWTTAGTTQKLNEEAVLAAKSSICVAQFREDPNYGEKIKEFENIESWKRYEFIEKGGWDKMPGQEEADWGVSRSCSDRLETQIYK